MSYSVIIHLSGEDPVLGEVDVALDLFRRDRLRGHPVHQPFVLVHNPRRRDGKDVQYLSNNVVAAIWPINQISFIEVMPSESEDKIIGFVRE